MAEIFISEADNEPIGGGNGKTYQFKVVRAGEIRTIPPGNFRPSWTNQTIRPPQWNRGVDFASLNPPQTFETATSFPQIYRCAIATVVLTRAARVFEIGFRSTVGIQINGLCNFRDVPDLRRINDDAGMRFDEKTYSKDAKLGTSTYQSGSISRVEARYSFFRIYRRAENSSTPDWTDINCTFAVRSQTSAAVYNSIRFEFPESRRWELMIEPLSGWEMRYNTANGGVKPPLVILDAHVTTKESITLSGSNIGVFWTGTVVSRSADVFRLPSLEPSSRPSIGWTDESSVLDDWARIAEAFAYSELQTTATGGPEHEIAYINIVSENDTTPKYDNIATVGLNIQAGTDISQLDQFSAYVTQGHTTCVGGNDVVTNLFPWVLRDMMLSTVYGAGDAYSEAQIDSVSFSAAAQWCQNRRYFYDVAVTKKVNLRQFAADIAGTMLLELCQKGGKWAFSPAIYFPEVGPVPIKALFTTGNTVENSFTLEFLNQEDRLPIQASVKWREERSRSDYTSSGFFPTEREVLVTERDRVSYSDPIESFDLSAYCTNVEHAIDFACYVIRTRRLITHSIRFATTPDGLTSSLGTGDYIKVAMDHTFYDEFNNGAILADGTLITTQPDSLAAGTYPAALWAGSTEPVYDGQVVVSSDGTASPTGSLFVIKQVNKQVRTYKIESIAINQEGIIDIEAVHHPVDDFGISLIGKNFPTFSQTEKRYISDNYWVIQYG
jgi:hypothetical protein